MSDIKISQMEPWVGALTGNEEFPVVTANAQGTNYRVALSQITPSTLGFGSMALQNSDAVSITGGNVAVTALSGAITIANGGTGLGTTPTNGQLLIGNGSGYTLSTLTAGSGVTITNSSGGIEISATGAGSVTSVGLDGGTTGITVSGVNPITTSGTFTLGGVLNIANGGTGSTTASGARTALGAAKSGANSDITSLSGLTTPLSTAQGGTGAAASLSGYIFGNGSSAFTSVASIPVSDLTGVLPVANGGTGASTASGARANLLNSYAGNAGKILAVNTLGTDTEWVSVSGVGTVTSVDVSGGTTGLTTSGGPITAAGTITLSGTLNVANGGTGATSAATARSNLGAAASGANTDITSVALTTGTVSTTPASANDIANKTYVDNLVSSGTSFHTPVKYEVPNTTGNLNATYNNGASGVGATLTNAGTLAAFTPDGVVAQVGDRILIYNQTNAAQNGVYTVTIVGSGSVAWVLTRATDADSYGLKDPDALGNGDAFFVTSGNTGAGETYICNTPGVITFGTTAITFAQISAAQVYSAGTGLTLTGTTFSLTAPVTVSLGGTGVTTLTSGYLLKGNGTSAVSASVIYDNGTNVGIGTASPSDPLTVVGPNEFSLGTRFRTSSTQTPVLSHPVSLFDNTSTAAGNGVNIRFRIADTSGAMQTSAGVGAIATAKTASSVTADMYFYVGAAERMRIDSSGNLLLGTTTAYQKFTINGSIQLARGNLINFSDSASLTNLISGDTSNNMLFWTAGAERMRIDSSGNLGIGTASPGYKLDVAVGGSVGATIDTIRAYAAVGSTATARMIFGSAANTESAAIGAQTTAATTGDLTFYTDTAGSLTEKMRLDSSGNLGIGTSSPATKLDVSVSGGMMRVGGASGNNLTQTYTGSVGLGMWAGGSSRLYTTGGLTFSVNATIGTSAPTGYTDAMTLDSSGNLGIGTASPGSPLDIVTTVSGANGITVRGRSSDEVSNISFKTNNAATTYAQIQGRSTELRLQTNSTLPVTIYTNSTEYFRIGPAGQIGLSGANYGTSGQVLTSNGSGAAPTWQNAPATGVTQAKATVLSMILGF